MARLGKQQGQRAGDIKEEETARSMGETARRWITLPWRLLAGVGLFVIVCVVAVSFVLLWQFDENLVAKQQAGEVALADWLAPKSHTYQSAVRAKEVGDQAANQLSNRVFKRDDALIARERDNLANLLKVIATARGNGQDANGLASDSAVKPTGLSVAQLTALLNLPDSSWEQVNQEARTAFSIEMNRDIMPGQEINTLNNLRDAVFIPYTISATFNGLDQPSRELTISLVKPFIKANNVIDGPATDKKREEARAGAGPVTVDIVKGTFLVRRGDVLTPLQIEELQELGLRNNTYNLGLATGTVGVVTMLVLLLVFYCLTLAPGVWSNARWPAFITLCLVVAALALRVLVMGADKDSLRPYLLPLAAVSMVVAALFDVNLALFIASLLALLAGITGTSPELAVVFFVGCAAGALAIRRAENTGVFAWAGLVVALGQFVAGVCVALLDGRLEAINLSLLLLFSLLNGLMSASLAFFCFSVLGKLFGVATVLQLLELAHPNQPLLRRLIREAPGTYHHSILVSNLAEQAAERLSDNALLARVGAYYHDIGKLVRPSYYIDNQAGGTNIHDQLDPRESAKYIRSHVSDGVALARKHKLPRKVVDIIHQHHGTCMISFFYQKALKMGLDVNELEFRYPGPKPQTKVAALVMLADGCEAAVRANVQSGRILTGTSVSVPAAPNPDTSNVKLLTIRDVVNKIIDDRIHENQLSECDLTLRDVDEVRNLFVEILTSIYHPRIIYPDKEIGQPTPETAPTTITTVTQEGSVGLPTFVTVGIEPDPVTAGAADSGGNTFQPSHLPSDPPKSSNRTFRPGRNRIGGAGRRVDKTGDNSDTRGREGESA